MLHSFPWPTSLGAPCFASAPTWVKDFRWRYFIWRSISCHHPFITPQLPVIFKAQEENASSMMVNHSLGSCLLHLFSLIMVAPTTVFSTSSIKSMYCSPSIGSFLKAIIWSVVKATVNLLFLAVLFLCRIKKKTMQSVRNFEWHCWNGSLQCPHLGIQFLSSLSCCSCAYILTLSLSSLQSPTSSQYFGCVHLVLLPCINKRTFQCCWNLGLHQLQTFVWVTHIPPHTFELQTYPQSLLQCCLLLVGLAVFLSL